MISAQKGFKVPTVEELAPYHPQFALAMAMGVQARPNARPLSVSFASDAVPQKFLNASFSEVIGSYSVFLGVHVTIDPTNAFIGNVLKTLSDDKQTNTSGVTATVQIKGFGGDYSPVPEETPLQSIAEVLNPWAGAWALRNPENVKVRFTLQSAPPALPVTVWMVWGFAVLAEGGEQYLILDRATALAQLKQMGISF
jgi:hypothetical protein